MNRSAVRQIGLTAIGSAAALIVFVAFAARQVIDVRQPQAGAAMGEIVAGRWIGQTFVSHRPNFDRLDLLLATYARTNPGQLDVKISPLDGRGMVQRSSVAASTIIDNHYHSFTFAPIANSAGRAYVVRLSSTSARPGQGVTAWSAPADVYPEGTTLVDGRADPGRDLTFVALSRLSVFDWFNELGQGLGRDRGAVALAVLLLFLPGLALLGMLGHALDLDVVSTIAIAPGLSIAAIALVYLWADLFGIPIFLPSVLLLLILCLPFASLGLRRARSVAAREAIGVFVLVGLATATELAIVNRVDVPFWGDSYQHTVIVRLLLDHHGLFTNWQPYADLQSFTYHFGFHGYAAALATLAGLSAPEAVIVAAQILVAAVALASVAFARAFGVGAFGSVVALVVVAFFSPMPSYFVNWGRDTQLAGLLVLGSSVALWMVGFRPREGGVSPAFPVLLLLSVSVAGLGLTHYREVLIFGVFVVAWLVVAFGRQWLRRGTDPAVVPPAREDGDCRRGDGIGADWDDASLVRRIGAVGTIGVGALLLTGPWLPRLLAFAANARQIAAPPVSWATAYNAFGDLGFFVPWPLLAIALSGLALRLSRRQADVLILVLWLGGCFVFANLPLLGRPSGALVNNFSVEIGLFLPVSVAIGLFADDLASVRLSGVRERGLGVPARSWHRWIVPPGSRRSHLTHPLAPDSGPWLRLRPEASRLHAVVLGIVVGLAAVGSTHQLSILDRNQALVLDADRPAFRWIQANTPKGARFLVNSFLGMGGTVAVGSDAGWWLPILANRPTTLPPVNYTDERMPPAQRELVRRLAAFPPDQWGTAAGLHLLRQAGVGYVFLGAAGGRLSPADFDGQTAFQVMFVSGPTRVYRVVDERSK
ncbi:MAG TPA: DUF6541 family protein [Chloroflexota bacterium]|nr:DUF6541 family protein [Chloroflexota bacterium]